MKKNKEKLEWWQKARFGLFLHWGLYSLLGRGEWVMWWEKIPAEDYARLAERFRPAAGVAETWVKLAKEAGMSYVILTTRHHDGFSLFHSCHSCFNAYQFCGRDLVAEFVATCRQYNMGIGLYYSLLDWRWPAYHHGPNKNSKEWRKFLAYVHGQVEELVSRYGQIDILWYDGSWPYQAKDWQAKRLNAMVRKYQPSILINDRSTTPEDFDTHSEQKIEVKDRPWECVMPLSDFWWGYIPGDKHPKTPYQVIRNLILCASHGGNYTINVGPGPDGSIPETDRQILLEAGKWLKKNGESIYGTKQGIDNQIPTPLATPWGGATRGENKMYLHVLYWHREFVVASVRQKVKQAYFLTTGKPVKFKQEGNRVFLTGLPEKAPDRYATVIVLAW